MNEKAIEQLIKQTRNAVESARARGETELHFSDLYLSLADVNLNDEEKEEVKRRLAEYGWSIENKVVLRFNKNSN